MGFVRKNSTYPGIQYHGVSGSSHECQDAVVRLVQSRLQINRGRVLTCENEHALLLTVDVGDLIAIKSGFMSGYGGEGPRSFSYVLKLLDVMGVDIEEYHVSRQLLNRLEMSALTSA